MRTPSVYALSFLCLGATICFWGQRRSGHLTASMFRGRRYPNQQHDGPMRYNLPNDQLMQFHGQTARSISVVRRGRLCRRVRQSMSSPPVKNGCRTASRHAAQLDGGNRSVDEHCPGDGSRVASHRTARRVAFYPAPDESVTRE